MMVSHLLQAIQISNLITVVGLATFLMLMEHFWQELNRPFKCVYTPVSAEVFGLSFLINKN